VGQGGDLFNEAYDATGDNAEAVARGTAATGRVITSAALIMTVVFASFIANPSALVKMLGVGLSTAIVLDATIVRMVLVPATMALLGRANWWLPGWLDRYLRRSHSEAEAGWTVRSTTVSSSADRVSRSTWSRRRPLNTSTVRAAS
jgi:uncharacterized membrane protein YdfJ with MMPL/SSD domain